MGLFDFFKSNSVNSVIDLSDIKFISDDHIRYQNGQDVSGHNKDCWRGIRIQNNISGGEGYTITIYNLDGNHSLWGDNIQMAPKQMKIVEQNSSVIKLRGYGTDPMGSSFADYGLTININNSTVEKATLHMHDRNIDIVYFKATAQQQSKQVVAVDEELEMLFMTGVQAMNDYDCDKAIKYFKKALELKDIAKYDNPNWESACHYNLGEVLNEVGNYSEALQAYKNAVEKNSLNHSAQLRIIECTVQINNKRQ